MGFFFTFLYIVTAYVTPPVLFGPLSEYHVEIIVVLLALLTSVPALPGSGVLRAPQSAACAGMAVVAGISIAQSGWLGGAFSTFYGFMQPALAFYLVAINCRTRRHLQWILFAMLLGSTYFMVLGVLDLRTQVFPSLYLYGDMTLRRLRGLGFINDPNDFGQVLVSLTPAIFFWKSKNHAANLFLVGVPLCILLTATFLTHSRGAALALITVVIMSSKRKIGTIPAAIVAALLFGLSVAIGWSGGRDTSMEAGSDRLDLWSGGLEVIKAHPLFGVGVNRLPDYLGLTAHNTVVVCTAEIGLVGFFLWVLLIFSTLRSGFLLSREPGSAQKAPDESDSLPAFAGSHWPASDAVGALPLESRQAPPPSFLLPGQPFAEEDDTHLPDEELRRLAKLLLFSLTGFLTAGWFLSRAFSMFLFMYCGMMFAVVRMAKEKGILQLDKLGFLLRWTLVATVGLLLLVYAILRVRGG